MRKKQHYPLFVIAVIVSTGLLGFAQVSTGTISGVVKDSSGAILPGVNVTVRHVDTGQSRVIMSDDGGRYGLPAIDLGQLRSGDGTDGISDERPATLPNVAAAVKEGLLSALPVVALP
ncbi:MAG: carboxypeptidase regulatory-like domain-containing protein [Acidobacteria bacterium]|nr:carboxypeptidase regulatory-like domain-containing protein [Acidobacteriota bacterium]